MVKSLAEYRRIMNQYQSPDESLNNQPSSFYDLDPNLILASVEKNGFVPTGELQQLNSYENRVFEIKLENHPPLIAKYYRPQRWSEKTILDEHQFIHELQQDGIETAEPFLLKNNSTLDTVDGIHYAFFRKVQGRLLQELTPNHLRRLGRWLGRLHNIGATRPAQYRTTMGPSADQKWAQLDRMLNEVSPEVLYRYEQAAVQIFEQLDELLPQFDFIRLHGDLHRGNILEKSNSDFVVVDFDDMINGPAIQDFWMLLPNADLQNSDELDFLIEGYSELREFPTEQLELIPLLRGYRIITYALWIMNRWSDPSFPRLFPNYGTYSYWAEETESLEKILL